MEIKRILFPTDFSEPSHHALPHALRIAQKYEAELTVLHVRTVHSDDPNRPEYRFLDRGRYEEYIKNSLSQLSDTVAPQHKVTTAVSREFSPASGILEFIRDNSVDVTVMGTHGRSALTHFFLGSVAEQVVRSARSPVLTVAHKGENYASNPDFQNILIAFDFSEHSREATHHVCAMADRYGAHLQAIYVIEQEVPPAYYGIWKNTLNQQLPEITAETREALGEALGGGRSFDSRDVHVKIGEGKAYREITAFARENQVDLIVMGTHGRAGLERMLLGSTTERVIRIAPCPVLTFKLDGEPADPET